MTKVAAGLWFSDQLPEESHSFFARFSLFAFSVKA